MDPAKPSPEPAIVHPRPAIQPLQIPRHLLLLTVILEPVRRKLQVILLIFTTI